MSSEAPEIKCSLGTLTRVEGTQSYLLKTDSYTLEVAYNSHRTDPWYASFQTSRYSFHSSRATLVEAINSALSLTSLVHLKVP